MKIAVVLLSLASFVGGLYAQSFVSLTDIATAEADIKNLKSNVERLQGDYATRADIARIEKRLDSLGDKMDRVLTRRR